MADLLGCGHDARTFGARGTLSPEDFDCCSAAVLTKPPTPYRPHQWKLRQVSVTRAALDSELCSRCHCSHVEEVAMALPPLAYMEGLSCVEVCGQSRQPPLIAEVATLHSLTFERKTKEAFTYWPRVCDLFQALFLPPCLCSVSTTCMYVV